MRYVYGPVNSRRIGKSLGISLTPFKVCDFDCIYCQLGKTVKRVLERKAYVSAKAVLSELKSWLAENRRKVSGLDFITISGLGEPTLNKDIGDVIAGIKRMTDVPVCVITNSSFINSARVRKALQMADLVIPSLDSATVKGFKCVDRPAPGIKLSDIIKGLIKFRQGFKGKLWLEVMLVKGKNDSPDQIRRLKAAIDRIGPDRIQVNSPVRATAEPGVLAVPKKRLLKICRILGDKCEIV